MSSERTPPVRFAVLGLGRAGLARCRELAALEGATLAAVQSRRDPSVFSLPAELFRSEEEIFNDPTIDAVIICTENEHHARLCMSGLEATKDVLVEYPLAGSSREASALFSLAEERGAYLALELLGRQSGRYLAHRALARDGQLNELHIYAAGGLYRWVALEASRGHWGRLAVGRLHSLYGLFGALSLERAELESRLDGGYRLELEFISARGQRCILQEVRAPGERRVSHWEARDSVGAPLTISPPSRGASLFGEDLRSFMRERSAGSASAALIERATAAEIIAVLALAEEIDTLLGERISSA